MTATTASASEGCSDDKRVNGKAAAMGAHWGQRPRGPRQQEQAQLGSKRLRTSGAPELRTETERPEGLNLRFPPSRLPRELIKVVRPDVATSPLQGDPYLLPSSSSPPASLGSGNPNLPARVPAGPANPPWLWNESRKFLTRL